jgi:MFS family permease
MGLVLGLSVLSQLINVVFFRVWGALADRFTNKSVLGVSGPMFILSILLWPFLTMPERHFLTIPLLVAIHVLAGISTAGVMLCSGNIALKAAPLGKATSFLAANALTSGLAATVAPVLAGLAADGFSGQELSLSLKWTSTNSGSPLFDWPALSLQGLDFLFVIAVVLGVYALHRLALVREEGEVEEEVVMNELMGQVRKAVRHVSNVAGLRTLTYFPYMKLEEVAARDEDRRGGKTEAAAEGDGTGP